MEKNDLKKRYAIKFCVKLGEGPTDRYLWEDSAFGNDSLLPAQAFRWYKDSVNGRETVGDEPRSGRLAYMRTSTNVDRVRAFIRQDRRLTIRMMADELNECTVHQTDTQDFNIKTVCVCVCVCVCAEIVAKNLNN
jgi:hypothetical protein